MNDKTSDKLLKCPFCGGEAEFYRTPVKTNGGWCDSVVVRCKNCEARTNRVLYDAKKHPNDEEYNEAAAAWNQRKPIERIVERLENMLSKKHKLFLREDRGEIRYFYEMNMIKKIIEIIKEEGGLND